MTTAPAALQLGHLAFQLLHSLLNLQQRHDEELHRLRRLLPIGVGNRNARKFLHWAPRVGQRTTTVRR